MRHSRIELALDEGLALGEGRIALLGPGPDVDLSALPLGRCQVIQPIYPDFQHWQKAGFDCAVAPEGSFGAAIVFVPRAKAYARALIAEASRIAAGGLILVDGQKTDGIESLLKECRRRTPISGTVSKAHGKLFWMQAEDVFSDWQEQASEIAPGFTTLPGVFSADGVDQASALLVETLPDDLGKYVADLGAGWGFLAKAVLQRQGVQTLHLVEADHRALGCARQNIGNDPRAQFHWADATTWQTPRFLDTVVTNPPFHAARAADPDLGRAFIAAAAGMLALSGQLWLVANRHLPYEATLASHFARVDEVAVAAGFKVIQAQRPARKRR